MKKPRVCLDTSVVGGCEDEEFAEASRELLAQAQAGKLVLLVSDLLMGELARAPEAVRQRLAGLAPECVEYVPETEEARSLRDCYVAAGIVGPAQVNDALHVAQRDGGARGCDRELEFQAYRPLRQNPPLQRGEPARGLLSGGHPLADRNSVNHEDETVRLRGDERAHPAGDGGGGGAARERRNETPPR